MQQILVCDDDKEIVEAISIYLNLENYKVLKAYDGVEALDIMKKERVDLLILDIMMPRMDGIHATMELRKKSNIPIIILSAKSEDADKVLGLNVGADDYMMKPFSPLELVARVKSQLRRYTTLGTQIGSANNEVVNGSISINDEKKQILVDGKEVRFTPIEYKILKLLMDNVDIVFSTSQIYEKIWDEDAYGAENIIAVHIRHIREKIEINPKEPRYIKAVWGQGYKMTKVR